MAARDHVKQALDSLRADRETTVAERKRLDAELSRLDRAIDGLETTMKDLSADPSPSKIVNVVGMPSAPGQSVARPYAEGVDLIDAAFDVLKKHGDQGNTDLARLILAGGFKTKSNTRGFGETVRAVLRRPKAERLGIARIDGKWTLLVV